MNNKLWDSIWINVSIVMLDKDGELGLVEKAALAVKENKIAWLGKMNQLNDPPENLANIVYPMGGRLITPGLIDCHTHVVYAGSRFLDFKMRLHGASYQDIANAGGGIFDTVTSTRIASEEELLEQSLPRVRALMASGVTTIEIKSGYGLNFETELKILRVAKKIGEMLPVKVVTTFLGAHAIPREYQDRSDAYVKLVCEKMLPALVQGKLVDAVDVFCDKVGFTLAQAEQIFIAAKKHDLKIRCHAEQFSNTGCATVAAGYQALSVDHLEYLSKDGVRALAKSGTVAVLLPGAFYFMREKHYPPIELLRQYKVPIAIASDCNPGTSPVGSLLLMLNMACTLFHLTPEEALIGVTRNAAKALGISDDFGSLEIEKIADFIVWNVRDPAELSYYIGFSPLHCYVKSGKIIDNFGNH
jgi:imidazolonepropionase